MRVRSLGRKDPLEEGMAAHFSIPAKRILWTEDPGWLRPIRVTKELDLTEVTASTDTCYYKF